MQPWNPPGLRAGFRVDLEKIGPGGLVHAGEQWAPPRYYLGPHEHEVWEFYLQISGSTRWGSGDRQYDLGPGHFWRVPPLTPHFMVRQPSGVHHFYFAALDIEAAGVELTRIDVGWSATKDCVYVPDGHSLMAPFAQLVRELTTDLPHAEEGLALAVEHLLLEVSRLLSSAGRERHLVTIHPAVHQACQLLEQHSTFPWTLARLASEVGLAPNYLAQLFSLETGMPPHRYLTEQRLRRAKNLLVHTDVPITTLALELGFSSSQHFARVFRSHAGCSPRLYRQQHGLAASG